MIRIRQYLTACVAVAIWHLPAMAGTLEFHDWTASFNSGQWSFTNTSSAGTITGTSSQPGIGAPTGTYGVPTVITSKLFTTEFSMGGGGNLPYIDFFFSPGYAWGSGGQLILGNIHNYFQYTLAAWDFNGNPIDINNDWTVLAEYDSTVPGTLGYFSTSQTQRSASGTASNFFVFDTSASASGGQGGVVLIGGLSNVGQIELLLSDDALAPNGQGSDFILFNVGTPTPEPTSGLLILGGLAVLASRLRRTQPTTVVTRGAISPPEPS